MEKLRPCPFCGGEDIKDYYIDAVISGGQMCELCCECCGASMDGLPRPSREEAYESAKGEWNRRAADKGGE